MEKEYKNLNTIIDAIVKMPEDIDKKVKGYGYDSLCLRYRHAREAQARLEYIKARRDGDMRHDESYYMSQATRDCVRFYQILDDLIGEHN